MLRVNEIFYSLAGESSFIGRPCVFVRLTGCNLRCSYCDTRYAYEEGNWFSQDALLEEIEKYPDSLVCITGGEPLLQEEVLPFMQNLCDRGKTVLLETNGSLPANKVDARVHKIVDFKCPQSGESAKNNLLNLEFLKPHDEVKFVVCDRKDYEWARDFSRRHCLLGRVHLLFSAAEPRLNLTQLAEWVLEDKLQVQVQPQLHKWLWPNDSRGK